MWEHEVQMALARYVDGATDALIKHATMIVG